MTSSPSVAGADAVAVFDELSLLAAHNTVDEFVTQYGPDQLVVPLKYCAKGYLPFTMEAATRNTLYCDTARHRSIPDVRVRRSLVPSNSTPESVGPIVMYSGLFAAVD